MKKIARRVFTLCAVALMVMGITTLAYANSDTYMYVKSDNGHIDNLIRISNAVRMDDKMHGATLSYFGRYVDRQECNAYFCNSPVEVKAFDDVDKFRIFNLKKNTGTLSVDNSKLKDTEWYIGDDVSYNSKEKIVAGKTVLEGVTAKLTTGAYLVAAAKGGDDAVAVIIVKNTDGSSDNITVNNDVTATPTTSKVLVNGDNTAFDAYTINDNNYFKLRDIAYALNGSGKQFDVTWDGVYDVIKLISNKSYTSVGGEMESKKIQIMQAKPTASKIPLDGRDVTLTAYNIAGNNYFKLRDIGQAFDFGVEWDGKNNTISINNEQ